MNIWRLIPHHIDPAKYAEWSRNKGTIAIGWGQMGDLRNHVFHDVNGLKQITARAHSTYPTNSKVNGGNSLWRLYHEMQKGDLVIISAKGSRKLTMRVTGDYYFVGTLDDPSHYYEHRRKAEVVLIDPNRLWHIAGGAAPGEGKYSTLIRCANALAEAEADALTD